MVDRALPGVPPTETVTADPVQNEVCRRFPPGSDTPSPLDLHDVRLLPYQHVEVLCSEGLTFRYVSIDFEISL